MDTQPVLVFENKRHAFKQPNPCPKFCFESGNFLPGEHKAFGASAGE